MFKKGDILRGTRKKFDEAYHPIVFLSDTDAEPLAVVLTHSGGLKHLCNIELSNQHVASGLDKNRQYFVAHRIQKLSAWSPYKKIGELTDQGSLFVEEFLPNGSITWQEYLQFTEHGCPNHS